MSLDEPAFDFITLPKRIDRDQYDRPLILQPDGTRIPYTRMSTFAKALDDSYGLMTWNLRLLALGMGRREDLAGMAAARTLADGKELDKIVSAALDFAGATEPANYGTAIHLFTAPGAPTQFIPERMQHDVEAWEKALAYERCEIIATEQFVVNDLYRIAGTFDHILRHPLWGNVLTDKKTGVIKTPFIGVQTSGYANSVRYDEETDQRTPLPDLNKDIAIAAHIPAGEGRCEFIPIDIRAGYLAVKTAAERRGWQKTDFTYKPTGEELAKLELIRGGLIEDPITAQLHAATSIEELNRIWSDHHENGWTVRHEAIGNARKRDLLERVSA